MCGRFGTKSERPLCSVVQILAIVLMGRPLQSDGVERSSLVHVIGIISNVSTEPSGALTLVYYDDLERGKGRNGLIVNLAHVLNSPDSLDVCALVR